MAAIRNGQSIDTSMGMTPLQGLIMGTRCGDIDPAVPFFLARHEGMDLEAIENLMNTQSGLKGLCGMNDMRDILEQRARGDARAALAVDMYTYSVKKHIGAYFAGLGRLDAAQNARDGRRPREIQAPDAPIRILVIHTDEEREIARQTLALIP